jgi:hypothetical protein
MPNICMTFRGILNLLEAVIYLLVALILIFSREVAAAGEANVEIGPQLAVSFQQIVHAGFAIRYCPCWRTHCHPALPAADREAHRVRSFNPVEIIMQAVMLVWNQP